MSLTCRGGLRRGGVELDVRLEVPPRGITVLAGPSGAGKTSLLRVIAGLERQGSWEIWLGGQCWQRGRKSVPTHRRGLAYVFQDAALFTHMSVRGNIEYGRRRSRGRPALLPLEALIEALALGPLLDRDPASLSGGEARRVALARALASAPRLLLLDEPLTGLDRATRDRLILVIAELARRSEVPWLYVTHSADELALLADHVALMEAGRIIALGPAAPILTRLDLPWARRRDAESILFGRVTGCHEDDLTEVEVGGFSLWVPGRGAAPPGQLRLRVAARDVSIALAAARHTSVLNLVPARVDDIRPLARGMVAVRLLLGEQPLVAHITARSCRALELAPGRDVVAQIKSVALLA